MHASIFLVGFLTLFNAVLAGPIGKNITESSQNQAKSCNGFSELCSRKYNEVTFAATHNSYALAPNLAGNQNKPIPQQLKDGIRGLMLDLHLTPGDPKTIRLCHTDCKLLDAGTLSSALQEIKSFLNENPTEVLTIFLENFSSVPVELVAAALTQNDLQKYAFAQAAGKPWPTLGQMIQSNKRLVVFIDDKADSKFPWIHHEFTYAWESPYSVPLNASFNCNVDRPKNQPQPIFVLNHFVFTELNIGQGNIAIPALSVASNTNGDQLNQHVQQCKKERNQTPNFIAVDFYNVGELFKVTALLNNVKYTPLPQETETSVKMTSHANSKASTLLQLSIIPLIFCSLLG